VKTWSGAGALVRARRHERRERGCVGAVAQESIANPGRTGDFPEPLGNVLRKRTFKGEQAVRILFAHETHNHAGCIRGSVRPRLRAGPCQGANGCHDQPGRLPRLCPG
jgi:hypothetical protein